MTQVEARVELDASQRSAVEVEPGRRQIVLAPPGSGKTEVVAALLHGLRDQGLEPADEILAISFSRAAVGALRRRITGAPGPAPSVTTLDSLASRILDDLDDSEWRHLDFDRRVTRATELLAEGESPVDVAMVRHLVVDEVQDLVGVRAELVLAIVDALDPEAGFTFLGDPDQAVYDFQLRDENDLTSAEFLDRIRLGGGVVDVRLDTQYRARTDQAQRAATMLRELPRGSRRTAVVRDFLAEVPLLGGASDVARAAARWRGGTAFLCRTNGQVLMVASELRAAGLPVVTRAAADELPIAPWVGRVLGGVTSAGVRRGDIEAALDRHAPQGVDVAWRLLKEAERDFRSGDRLDLRRLRTAITRRVLPAELLEGLSGRLVVSTVHRAKGLEFENVVLVNPSEMVPGDADDEVTSVAYVAATRARDQLLAATHTFPRSLRKDERIGRWIIGGPQKWMTFGVEVRAGDVEPVCDPETSAVVVPPGAPLTAVLDTLRSDLRFPTYSLSYEGVEVARTSEDFAWRLARRVGSIERGRRQWPRLSGLTVESYETRVTDSAGTDQHDITQAARVTGMADLQWKNGEH